MLGLDYNEQVSNELRNIPLSYHHINENHPFYHMPLHWHKPCEIVRVISGNLTVFMDDDAVHAKADEIVFVNQEIIHGYEPQNCTYEVIDFDSNAILLRTSLCKNILHTFANNKIRILPFHPIKNADLYDMQPSVHLYSKNHQRCVNISTLSNLLSMHYVCVPSFDEFPLYVYCDKLH